MWIAIAGTMGYKKSAIIVCVVMILCGWMNVCGNARRRTIHVDDLPQPVDGLSWKFYHTTCPKLESIVKSTLNSILAQDITQAAGLLRLHFHDCFVQGCDGSVLLNITDASSERQATPNRSLRDQAFVIIDQIKAAVEADCGGVVSCADILALAARDSVAKAGGPRYPVPLGRRDSLTFADNATVVANLPAPTSDVETLMSIFGPKGLSLTDLVSLSGGHTIGIGHCLAFENRLYNTDTGEAEQDPSLEQSYADSLYSVCPAAGNTLNSIDLDLLTPDAFDSNYYINLQNNQTLFTSDQTLYFNSTTRSIADSFAADQNVFFENFVLGMLKMGQLEVLTGTEGEIRSICSVSSADQIIRPIVDQQVTSAYADELR